MGYVACEKCVRGLKTGGWGETLALAHTTKKKTLGLTLGLTHRNSMLICCSGLITSLCVPCMRVSLFCIICTILGSITARNLGQNDLKVTRQPSRFLLPMCSRSNLNLVEGILSTLSFLFLSVSPLPREGSVPELPFSTFFPTPNLNR